jgi:two-component system sensor histidine kinase BaeS
MTRRITLTMVGVVGGALLVASVATVVLSRLAERRHTRTELAAQARRLATTVEDVRTRQVARAVATTLRLEDVRIVTAGPAGPTGALPSGVTAADLDLARLRAGATQTGAHGSLVFAAAPARRPNNLFVVVLTRRVGGGGGAGVVILAVGAITLAVAAAIAAGLGRRLTRPLSEARRATARIAAGDLAARVPVDPADGDDLAGLAQSINVMAASLERSRGLERQFLLSVSHDLRTPLTSIRGYAEALAEGRVPDPPQAAAVVLAEARRLERLVDDLLELAKVGARRFSLDVRRTDVTEVVSDTVDGFLPAAETAGVNLTVTGIREAAVPATVAQRWRRWDGARKLNVPAGVVTTDRSRRQPWRSRSSGTWCCTCATSSGRPASTATCSAGARSHPRRASPRPFPRRPSRHPGVAPTTSCSSSRWDRTPPRCPPAAGWACTTSG